MNTHEISELTKEERINQELAQLTDRFSGVDENKKAVIASLIQNAAFMKVTLEDLQAIINAEGVTEAYQNGANQHGTKQSSTLQSYNALIKNYAAVIKTLTAIVQTAPRPFVNPYKLYDEDVKQINEMDIDESERQRRLLAAKNELIHRLHS